MLGGAASGKSDLGVSLAEQGIRHDAPRAFLATAQARDGEMTRKILRHQTSRDSRWTTKEIPVDVIPWLWNEGAEYRAIVLDCITLWLNNLLEQAVRDQKILSMTHDLVQAVRGAKTRVVVITNELGLGLVPGQRLIRRFRDLSGQVNQVFAREADEVYLSIAGLPLRMK